jgi:RimJ/RimL family protein N-acetyltransferase
MNRFSIRQAVETDFAAIMRLYEDARVFMRENGNPEQWGTFHPPEELVRADIREGCGFVCECAAGTPRDICAVFAFLTGEDPTYKIIYHGRWLNSEPYGVVHRIAASRAYKGAGAFCLDWAFEQCGNLRIDTHRDNRPMRNLLAKLDFAYCGIIDTHGFGERLAYQKYASKR